MVVTRGDVFKRGNIGSGSGKSTCQRKGRGDGILGRGTGMSKGMKEKSACAEKQVDSRGWSRTCREKGDRRQCWTRKLGLDCK